MSSETNQNSPEDMSSTAGSWYVSTAVHWVPLPNRPLTDVTRSSTWTMGTWTTSWTAKHSEFKSVGSGERCLKNEAQRKKHCKSGRLTYISIHYLWIHSAVDGAYISSCYGAFRPGQNPKQRAMKSLKSHLLPKIIFYPQLHENAKRDGFGCAFSLEVERRYFCPIEEKEVS